MFLSSTTRCLAILTASLLTLSAHSQETDAPIMVGGYRQVAVSPELESVAATAIEAQSKKEGSTIELVKISQAEAQLVAGMNYRLVLEVTQGGTPRTAKASVHRGLDRKQRLTSWTWQETK